ncbi:chemotaxis protein CheW [Phycicoccus avicenniae]|uniref:chemotaxis protein CheW n=1 Tax=Phycicoccus avicenniae TaxID=2828860 RepID=UPI003D2DA9ED
MSGSTYVTFSLGEHLVGLPVDRVQEVLGALPMTPVPRADGRVAGLLNLRGQVVTGIDLRSRFGLPTGEEGTGTVVVRSPGGPVALVVDRIGDVIDVDDPQPPPATLVGPIRDLVRGAYVLADSLLLDVRLDAVLSLDR